MPGSKRSVGNGDMGELDLVPEIVDEEARRSAVERLVAHRELGLNKDRAGASRAAKLCATRPVGGAHVQSQPTNA